MLRIAIIALTLAICAGPALAEKAKIKQTKTGRSYKECQNRAAALGLNRKTGSSVDNTNVQDYMSRCGRGKI
jgi:hypothetical protein